MMAAISADTVPQALANAGFPAGKCALIGLPCTAFSGDRGASLRPGAVSEQHAFKRERAVDVVLVGGTTDEWPSQSLRERKELARAWRAVQPAEDAGVKLMMHVGANAITDARALAQLALELEYDAILVSALTVFAAPGLATHFVFLQRPSSRHRAAFPCSTTTSLACIETTLSP